VLPLHGLAYAVFCCDFDSTNREHHRIYYTQRLHNNGGSGTMSKGAHSHVQRMWRNTRPHRMLCDVILSLHDIMILFKAEACCRGYGQE
jgi:hypothetical protein